VGFGGLDEGELIGTEVEGHGRSGGVRRTYRDPTAMAP
jgi:hypothetical protein